jgi:hypothetical protein
MRILTLIVLTFIGVQLAHADSDNVTVWSSYIGINRYDFAVSLAEIARTPVWRESDDHPPLAPRKALKLARACLAKLVTDAEHWLLHEVSLSSLSEHDGHWVYLVSFYPPLPPNGVWEGIVEPMTIPVLMSGVAVQPKISLRKR